MVAVDEFIEAMLRLGVVANGDEGHGLGLGTGFKLPKEVERIRRTPVDDDQVRRAPFGGADGFQQHRDNGAEYVRVIDRVHDGRGGLGAAGKQEDLLQSTCFPQVERDILELGSTLGEKMASAE